MQCEGLPWYRAARAVGVGVDLDAMDQMDTASLVERSRCVVTELPADAIYEYRRGSTAIVDGYNVVLPASGEGRWILVAIAGSGVFIRQTAWYVDAVAGDDGNGGTSWADALQTLPELALRWNDGVFDPSAIDVNVYLRGAFMQTLELRATFTGLTAITTIQGEMAAPLHTGVITTYTAFNPAGGIRASVAEAAVDLSAFVGKRMRVTDGAVVGAVTHIAEASGLTALVGQFNRIVAGSGSTSNPANGSAYVVEDYATSVPNFEIELRGTRTVVRDLRVEATADSIRSSLKSSFGSLASGVLFGCDLNTSSVINIGGNFSMTACQNRGAVIFLGFMGRQIAHVAKAPINFSDGSFAACFNNIHQGATATFSVDTGSTVEDLGHRGMFAVGGAEAFSVSTLGRFFQLNTSSLLWGSGNTATATVKVWGPSQFGYFSVPTVIGTGTDAVIGGIAKTWAQVPYVDIGGGTNNSGAMIVLQQ